MRSASDTATKVCALYENYNRIKTNYGVYRCVMIKLQVIIVR